MAVVTLTTDFGTADAYAGAMKGVVLSLAPDAVLVDITHQIPRHDVLAGALALSEAARFFPSGSVHVAVVDPGVGSARASLVVKSQGCLFVGPDNGVLSLAVRQPRAVFRIENPLFRREPVSPTFHGRDVFAVAAGRLASGASAAQAGPPMDAMVELGPADSGPLGDGGRGVVVHVDGFGNMVTSFTAGSTSGLWQLVCGDRQFDLRGGLTFADVEPGAFVLYLGSSGRVEIAVREGAAADLTGAKAGANVQLRRRS